MNTKRKPSPTVVPTPDLLTPVVAALRSLPPRELERAALDCNASAGTLKNIRDEKTGPLGPSYHLIVKLYEHLVKEPAAAPTQ